MTKQQRIKTGCGPISDVMNTVRTCGKSIKYVCMAVFISVHFLCSIYAYIAHVYLHMFVIHCGCTDQVY